MDTETLNQVGLAAQFVAFWFVTPEVVTPNTLDQGASTLRKSAAWIGRQASRARSGWPFGLVVGVAIILLIIRQTELLAGSTPFLYIYFSVFLLIVLAILLVVIEGLFLLLSRFLEATERWRRRFAVSGALLFVVGTAAQLAATF